MAVAVAARTRLGSSEHWEKHEYHTTHSPISSPNRSTFRRMGPFLKEPLKHKKTKHGPNSRTDSPRIELFNVLLGV